MPNMVTLRDIINTFTEKELDLQVPIDFKNPTSETIEYVNQYNKYLADGNYEDAYQYRQENSDILEPLICDATKLNIQQSMMINTYLFARGEKIAENTSYDNSNSGINSNTVQGAIDEICDTLGMNGISSEGSLCDRVDTVEKQLKETNSDIDDLSERINECFQRGSDIKSQVIAALSYTNQGLTEDSSWTDICNVLNTLFPQTLNLLSKWGLGRIYCDSGGTYTSPEFDITTFKTLVCSAVAQNAVTGTWYPTWGSNNGNVGAYIYLNTTSGRISIANQTSIDVSKYTGSAYITVYTYNTTISDSATGSVWTAGSIANITKLLLQA